MSTEPPRPREFGNWMRVSAVSLAFMVLAAPQCLAQTRAPPSSRSKTTARAPARPPAPPPTPATAPTPQDLRPPYEPQLLRLSEIIGALAYLRNLCGDNDGDKWRAKMADLLGAEASSASERQRLAGAYNHGFRGYQLTYRTCTANAELVIARYLDEGEKLARDVQNRYGGG